jgi:hypothetical protein
MMLPELEEVGLPQSALSLLLRGAFRILKPCNTVQFAEDNLLIEERRLLI